MRMALSSFDSWMNYRVNYIKLEQEQSLVNTGKTVFLVL